MHFLGNQNGILGIADKGFEGTVTIRGSAFENNGAEDGIRDVERSRGLGDVYKRQFYYTG